MASSTYPQVVRDLVICATGLFLCSPSDVAAEEEVEQIKDLAERVAAFEQRFENMELHLLSEYELIQPVESEEDGLTKLKTRRIHQVTQRPLVFIHRRSIGVAVDQDVTNRHNWYAYDGKTSRMISTNEVDDHPSVSIENDSQGRSGLWTPHTAVVPKFFWSEKMSDALLLDAHDGDRLRTFVAGEEKVGEFKCIKVTTEFWSPGRKHPDLTHFWCCPERSYLPVKREGYLYGRDGHSLVERCEVKKFEQLEAGLWIPSELERTVYYKPENGNGKNAVSNVTKYFIKDLELNPKYPLDFFKLKIPDGSHVYESRGGVLIREYWYQSPADEKPEPEDDQSSRG